MKREYQVFLYTGTLIIGLHLYGLNQLFFRVAKWDYYDTEVILF